MRKEHSELHRLRIAVAFCCTCDTAASQTHSKTQSYEYHGQRHQTIPCIAQTCTLLHTPCIWLCCTGTAKAKLVTSVLRSYIMTTESKRQDICGGCLWFSAIGCWSERFQQ